jgi:hypothetical protein
MPMQADNVREAFKVYPIILKAKDLMLGHLCADLYHIRDVI